MSDVNKYNDVFFFMTAIAAMIATTMFFLYGQGGVEVVGNEAKFWTYTGSGLIFSAFLIVLAFKRNKDKIYYFTSIIHDPEEGMLGNFGFVRSASKLILLSLIIFTIAGMFGAATNTFANTPEFQVTETAQIGLNSEPAAWSETVLLVFLIIFIGGILFWIFDRFFGTGRNKETRLIAYFMAALIVGFALFPAYHTVRYGEQEQNIAGVMMLGGGCSILTVATWSIIPCWIWHSEQNAFKKMNEIFSDETTYLIGITIIILMSILYLMVFVRKPKQRGEQIV